MSRNPSSPILLPVEETLLQPGDQVGRFEVQDDGTLLAGDGTRLYQWPSGWRYVPVPTECQQCGAPATQLLIWNDHMRRADDFAGCDHCIIAKRWEAQKVDRFAELYTL